MNLVIADGISCMSATCKITYRNYHIDFPKFETIINSSAPAMVFPLNVILRSFTVPQTNETKLMMEIKLSTLFALHTKKKPAYFLLCR